MVGLSVGQAILPALVAQTGLSAPHRAPVLRTDNLEVAPEALGRYRRQLGGGSAGNLPAPALRSSPAAERIPDGCHRTLSRSRGQRHGEQWDSLIAWRTKRFLVLGDE